VQETDILLTNQIGLHAPPAALLVRSVAGLDAEVTVTLGDQRADAGSVLGLLPPGRASWRSDPGVRAVSNDRCPITCTIR
jgi:hypothetical protein